MVALYHDGDLRRIYEVPDNSSFTVDANGYRVYVPNDIASATNRSVTTTTQLWSKFADYRQQEEWSLTAYIKSGGASRGLDANGFERFAPFDLFLINDWELVPADYPHTWLIQGNLFSNQETGRDFDTSRLESKGVIPRVELSEASQTTLVSGDGISSAVTSDVSYIRDILTNVEPGLSVRDFFRLAAAALFGEVSQENGEFVFKDTTGQIDRIQAVGDQSGSRTIRSLNTQ